MLYALRKLIAFVFLGGMFWLIYQDLENLDKPWFMHLLGMGAVAFAFFWLLIPMLVVRYRISKRRQQNKARYAQWLAEGGVAKMHERPARNARLALESGEKVHFHEKGTLYVDLAHSAGFDSPEHQVRPIGRPSDVAFSGFRRKCHVVQRTHCYFTSRRVAMTGKGLDFSIPFEKLRTVSIQPGGIVFEAGQGQQRVRFAFTFQNPLIAADMLRFAKEEK